MNIMVYLASSMGNTPDYYKQVVVFTHWLAQYDHYLAYGESKTGLMGALVDTVLAQGAKVHNTMPDFMQKREKIRQGLTHLQIVDDMDERKRPLMEEGDILAAFPGGPGTLEEIIQAISWARVGQPDKLCLPFNMNGYYDSLKEQFNQMVRVGLLTIVDRKKVIFADSLQALEEVISSY